MQVRPCFLEKMSSEKTILGFCLSLSEANQIFVLAALYIFEIESFSVVRAQLLVVGINFARIFALHLVDSEGKP